MHIKVKDSIGFSWQQVKPLTKQGVLLHNCHDGKIAPRCTPKVWGFNHQRYRIRVTLLDNFPHLAACILKSGWVAASIVTQCPEPSVFGGFICFDVRVYIIYLTTHFQWYWGFLRLPQSCNIRQGLASHFGWWLGRVRKMAGDPLNRQPKPKLSYACS